MDISVPADFDQEFNCGYNAAYDDPITCALDQCAQACDAYAGCVQFFVWHDPGNVEWWECSGKSDLSYNTIDGIDGNGG